MLIYINCILMREKCKNDGLRFLSILATFYFPFSEQNFKRIMAEMLWLSI